MKTIRKTCTSCGLPLLTNTATDRPECVGCIDSNHDVEKVKKLRLFTQRLTEAAMSVLGIDVKSPKWYVFPSEPGGTTDSVWTILFHQRTECKDEGCAAAHVGKLIEDGPMDDEFYIEVSSADVQDLFDEWIVGVYCEDDFDFALESIMEDFNQSLRWYCDTMITRK